MRAFASVSAIALALAPAALALECKLSVAQDFEQVMQDIAAKGPAGLVPPENQANGTSQVGTESSVSSENATVTPSQIPDDAPRSGRRLRLFKRQDGSKDNSKDDKKDGKKDDSKKSNGKGAGDSVTVECGTGEICAVWLVKDPELERQHQDADLLLCINATDPNFPFHDNYGGNGSLLTGEYELNGQKGNLKVKGNGAAPTPSPAVDLDGSCPGCATSEPSDDGEGEDDVEETSGRVSTGGNDNSDDTGAAFAYAPAVSMGAVAAVFAAFALL